MIDLRNGNRLRARKLCRRRDGRNSTLRKQDMETECWSLSLGTALVRWLLSLLSVKWRTPPALTSAIAGMDLSRACKVCMDDGVGTHPCITEVH